MNDVTRILAAMQAGDAQTSEKLLPLVYDELRRFAAERMAHERPGQTLQATALVLRGRDSRRLRQVSRCAKLSLRTDVVEHRSHASPG